jgi:dTDP-4-dehydrorhamnose reductase
LRIVADQYGSPTWSRTIADSTAHIVAQLGAGTQGNDRWQEVAGLYHMTAQGQTSWHGFTEAILAHASVARKPAVTPIRTEEYPLPASRPKNSVLSCERFISTFNGLPSWSAALDLCQS